MDPSEEALLAEQRAFYRAFAEEYDHVYAVRGSLRRLIERFDELPIGGDVLELACGTGQWTRRLAAKARSLTAVDAAAEMLEIARSRVGPDVEFVQADIFSWRPEKRYDTVFFSAWLSHIPPARLPAFWRSVAAMLTPDGRAVFIDENPRASATETVLTGEATPAVLRRLPDGSAYRVVKVFHDADALAAMLAAEGWTASVREAEQEFIIGVAHPPTP
ncbi:class I SAM-dependent methyltransferase [Actinomadura rupiterrae]|uniref:class I SAM-dependent methyltransferase n=1 Tax=Actinomadura rupiterrae TaxID=559627 RepID=UPI0020A504FB|nr:class I SAM-dependent methyltransferase [Actinomadura rupiterrae]MCP2341741.1 demethylmenaquinone methyltransferase/2-methoxy-6-polyprenyl-1,4-benzoquinol methylase [Actinomadura rupiterrae]